MQNYIVQRGDTIFGISKQFGISVKEIIETNNLPNENIYVGEVLKIPIKNKLIYIVQKNDTLYSISKKFNVDLIKLIKTNNLTNSNIYVGEKLIIPIESNEEENDYVIYIVKKGDSLYTISQKYNVKIDTIKKINNLTNNNLYIGQKLKIPTINSNKENIYIVKKGDTLYKIAKENNITVEELKKINNLTNPNLYIGQKLIILKKEDSYKIPLGAYCYGPGYKEKEYILYKVKPNDNLYTIAQKFNTSVENIKFLNNLKTDILQINDILKIKKKGD